MHECLANGGGRIYREIQFIVSMIMRLWQVVNTDVLYPRHSPTKTMKTALSSENIDERSRDVVKMGKCAVLFSSSYYDW